MRAHLGGDIVDAESSGGRVSEDAGDECPQLTPVMVWWVSLLRRRDDERADAAARFDDAGALELGVNARDGVGVDAEVDGELANGWQLIANLDAADGDRGTESSVELRVDRGAIPRVDGNQARGGHEARLQPLILRPSPYYLETIFKLSAEIIILPP